MKAISLWQPWASLIADGLKTIETRPRPWNHKGLVAIHAAKHVDRPACRMFGYDPDKIPRGAVVAIAHMDGCQQFASNDPRTDAYGDFTAGRYGYFLHSVRKLPLPIPAKGKQGIWLWARPSNCAHKCHNPESTLNPWVESCPICGCANFDYDPKAKAPEWLQEHMQLRGAIGMF